MGGAPFIASGGAVAFDDPVTGDSFRVRILIKGVANGAIGAGRAGQAGDFPVS